MTRIRFILLNHCLVLLLTMGYAVVGKAETYSGIDAEYRVRIDKNQRRLHVTATFSNIRSERFFIGFPNSFIWSEYDGTDLAERITNLKLEPEKAKLTFRDSTDALKLYRVETNGQTTLIFSYIFNTALVPYDVHFTALSSTTLHIPGLDFFIRRFETVQEARNGNLGLNRFRQFTIRYENLPSDWEIVSTYPVVADHSVLISDRSGGDVLLSAGKYKKLEIGSGNARITVAVDRGLDIDVGKYTAHIRNVFQYYHSIYRHIPESKVLLVINSDPRSFSGFDRSFGGQVKSQNIINSLGWGNCYDSDTLEMMILAHLAHEGHHIWLSHGFNLRENWYWFQEGVTEYICRKTLLTLGVITNERLNRELVRRYTKYKRNSVKSTKSLLQASMAKPTRDEINLNYNKGMLVAFLLDKQLRKQGKNLEQLLGDFYQTYGISQAPVGNREIIAFIDEYLGDQSFTKKYISGAGLISPELFEFGWNYYWWSIERYLPPLPFPYNVLVAFTSIIIFFLTVWLSIRLYKRQSKNQHVNRR